MKLIVLSIGFFIFLSWATDTVRSEDAVAPAQSQWPVKPYHAGYAKGNVAMQSNKGDNGELTADKGSRRAHMSVQGKGDADVGQVPNKEQAIATDSKGDKILANQMNKAKGSRSVETSGKYKGKGDMNTKTDGKEKTANAALNTGQTFNMNSHGGDKLKDATSADAKGNKGNTYNLKKDKQDKTGGSGEIKSSRDGNKPHHYKNSKTGTSDANAELTDVKGVTYRCQGTKAGVSTCVDQNGKKVGEVVEQPDGTVIVKKTISKGVDVAVAKGKVIKNQNGQSVVVVNDGLFQCGAGNYKERDCMADFGAKGGSKVKVEKPLNVKYNSESKDGRRIFQFPDCVTMSGKITLPPGVDGDRIAVQFDVNILPAGKLKCVDPGSCNKDCYYCDLCKNDKKADMLKNSNGRQACNLKGGSTMQVSAVACPPPDTFNKAQCSGFTKSDPNYFKKKGDLMTRLLIFARSPEELELKAKYYNMVAPNNILRSATKAQYMLEYKDFLSQNLNPVNEDFYLAEFYVKKNSKIKEQMVSCVEGTTNYTCSKDKKATTFLLEAGSVALQPKSLFDTKQCPQVDQINKVQSDSDKQEAAQNKPPATPWGNIANSLGNKLGGNFFGGR